MSNERSLSELLDDRYSQYKEQENNQHYDPQFQSWQEFLLQSVIGNSERTPELMRQYEVQLAAPNIGEFLKFHRVQCEQVMQSKWCAWNSPLAGIPEFELLDKHVLVEKFGQRWAALYIAVLEAERHFQHDDTSALMLAMYNLGCAAKSMKYPDAPIEEILRALSLLYRKQAGEIKNNAPAEVTREFAIYLAREKWLADHEQKISISEMALEVYVELNQHKIFEPYVPDKSQQVIKWLRPLAKAEFSWAQKPGRRKRGS